MWYKLGQFILKNRLPLLIVLLLATGLMGYKASKVELSYEFTRAIPTDNIKYQDYQAFLNKFGGDGNTMVLGIESKDFYTLKIFNQSAVLFQNLKKVNGVTSILCVPEALELKKDTAQEDKLVTGKIFHYPYTSQQQLDSAKLQFENLPFYKGLFYNPSVNAYLMAVTLKKEMVNSKDRTRLMNDIMAEAEKFEKATGITLHLK